MTEHRRTVSRYHHLTNAELVELPSGEPLGKDGLASVVEMMARLQQAQLASKAASDRWSAVLAVLTITLIVLTLATVHDIGQLGLALVAVALVVVAIWVARDFR